MCRLPFTARRKTWWILFFCHWIDFATRHLRAYAQSHQPNSALATEKEPIEESEFRVCDVMFEPHIVWLLNAGIRSGNGNAFHTRRSILMSFTNMGIRMKSVVPWMVAAVASAVIQFKNYYYFTRHSCAVRMKETNKKWQRPVASAERMKMQRNK